MRNSATFTGSCSTHRYFGPVANHVSVNQRDVSLRDSLEYHSKGKDYQALAAMCDTVLRCAQSGGLKLRAQMILNRIESKV